jgi:hypothetical protein
MSRPDEQLSTRDLASSSTEPRDETDATDDREDAGTDARYDGTTGEPTPEAAQDQRDPHTAIGGPSAGVAEPAAERSTDEAEPAAERSTDEAEPAAERSTEVTEPARDGDEPALLGEDEGAQLVTRWEAVQVTFVDDPRRAVEEADGLVAHVMQQLADGFARERETLEGQWTRGEDVSTEDLRVALQRYRSFFQRLLSA